MRPEPVRSIKPLAPAADAESLKRKPREEASAASPSAQKPKKPLPPPAEPEPGKRKPAEEAPADSPSAKKPKVAPKADSTKAVALQRHKETMAKFQKKVFVYSFFYFLLGH